MNKKRNKYFYQMHIVRFICVLFLCLSLVILLNFLKVEAVLVASVGYLYWQLRNSVAPIKREM